MKNADQAKLPDMVPGVVGCWLASNPSPPPSPCYFVDNLDFDQGTNGPLPSPAVASKEACCAACQAQPGCEAATYADGMCFMKNATQAGVPEYVGGVVGCWPSSRGPPPKPGPPPPPPPPGVLTCAGLPYETHG